MPTNRVFLKRLKNLGVDQSGAIAAYAAIGMVVFLGFAALTVDIGHMVSVKGELQKAADAGALAGARALTLIAPAPNWTNGTTVATTTVQKNKADGSLLTNCTVVPGYWDLAWSPSQKAEANLKSTGIVPGANDVAAVKVRVEKSSGNNGGPLTMLFAKVLGKSTEILKVQAVAAMVPGLPISSAPAGDAFPMATPISWVQLMWKPDVNSDSFRIGSAYHSDDGGQWTSFLTDANNVPTIRELIDNGNPVEIKIGDEIWIEPGTKTTLYDYASTRVGDTVLLPVVGNDFDTHADTPILAFVPFKITAAEGGSDKYIEGHFVPKYNVPGATGNANAPNFGAVGGSNVKLLN
jgi:Flp pilus assembly protein TadG